jgi:ATP-dependent helicase YprA (DUF1998 family)
MNALVEDQLTRLRAAFDSEGARKWYQDNLDGNRFYFGRYTGNTPVPGDRATGQDEKGRKIQRLIEKLREIDDASTEVRRAASIADTGKNTAGEDAIYSFQHLDGSKMRSRWDMQVAPPDIMITNFSMLSIMLMREVEDSIFEQTKAWLHEPGKDDRVFHLIIDEIHLYRGTAGTEVAYLLRLLLLRLGLTPDSPKLRILGSSASLGEDDKTAKTFLSNFFGAKGDSFHIIKGLREVSESTRKGDVDLKALAERTATEPFSSRPSTEISVKGIRMFGRWRNPSDSTKVPDARVLSRVPLSAASILATPVTKISRPSG